MAGMLVGLVVLGKMAASTLVFAVAARLAGLFAEAVLDVVIILLFVTSLARPLLTEWTGKCVVKSAC